MPLVRIPDPAGNTILLQRYGSREYLGMPGAEEPYVNLRNIPLRPDDVLLCSYPKSGCHWLWELSSMLLAGSADASIREKSTGMLELSTPQNMAALPSPRVLNTHVQFRQLPPAAQDGRNKIVLVHRNPKDVAVSFYNHHTKFPEYEYSGTFSDYLSLFLGGSVDSGSVFAYMREWEVALSRRPELPIFLVAFEELKQNPVEKSKELADFLGSELTADVVQAIVAKCSFSAMKERRGHEWVDADGNSIVYRAGQVGGWKTWFTVAQNEMFNAVYRKEMAGSTFPCCFSP